MTSVVTVSIFAFLVAFYVTSAYGETTPKSTEAVDKTKPPTDPSRRTFAIELNNGAGSLSFGRPDRSRNDRTKGNDNGGNIIGETLRIVGPAITSLIPFIARTIQCIFRIVQQIISGLGIQGSILGTIPGILAQIAGFFGGRH